MEEEIGCTVLPCIQLELNKIKMCCVLEDKASYTCLETVILLFSIQLCLGLTVVMTRRDLKQKKSD